MNVVVTVLLTFKSRDVSTVNPFGCCFTVRSNERKATVPNSRLLCQIEGKVYSQDLKNRFRKLSQRIMQVQVRWVDRSQRPTPASIFRCWVDTGSHVLRTFRGRSASSIIYLILPILVSRLTQLSSKTHPTRYNTKNATVSH